MLSASGVRFARKTCTASLPDCCCYSRLQATSSQLCWRPMHPRRMPAAGAQVLIPATILPVQRRKLSFATPVAASPIVAAPRSPRNGRILNRKLYRSLLAAPSDLSQKSSPPRLRRTKPSLIPRAHLLFIPRSLEIRVAQQITTRSGIHRRAES